MPSENTICPATEPRQLPDEILQLLKPRSGLPWLQTDTFVSPWNRPILIDNCVTRLFFQSVLDAEKSERDLIREDLDLELAKLSSRLYRFWRTEFDFVAKLLTTEQLAIYARAFGQLARLMPRELVVLRRQTVMRFLESLPDPDSPFCRRQRRLFVRSSVLLYPSQQLFPMAGEFRRLVIRCRDQSARANRKRVLMLLRALHIMSDTEICNRFVKEEAYLLELGLLEAQCRHFHIRAKEMYDISAEDLQRFWCL